VAVKSRFALVEAGFHPETMYYSFGINDATNANPIMGNDDSSASLLY
jgi:hypothetical protein